MKAEFINPFINSTVNVFKTMAQLNPAPGKPYLKHDKVTWGVVSGVIGMAGDKASGNMIISFDEPCILKVVSNMLMEEFTELNNDVLDAVGEITNMISGGARRELGEMGYSFEMAIPIIVRGKDVELTQITKQPILVVPFETENGRFVVEANVTDKPGHL